MEEGSQVLGYSGLSVSAAAPEPPCCTLFWASGSPPAWRARLCLEERGVAYESRMISFECGDTKTPEIRSLNPRGLIPILKHGSNVLYESLAILSFIESLPGTKIPTLLPQNDTALLAKALTRMHEANNLSSSAGEVVYYVRRIPPEKINTEYLEAKVADLIKELSYWESHCTESEYLAGSQISLADVSFFPGLAYIIRLGYSLRHWPNLSAYYERMCQRPAVQRTWPPHWLEGEGTRPLAGLEDDDSG